MFHNYIVPTCEGVILIAPKDSYLAPSADSNQKYL